MRFEDERILPRRHAVSAPLAGNVPLTAIALQLFIPRKVFVLVVVRAGIDRLIALWTPDLQNARDVVRFCIVQSLFDSACDHCGDEVVTANLIGLLTKTLKYSGTGQDDGPFCGKFIE